MSTEHQKQQTEFQAALMKQVRYFQSEYTLTTTDVIGTLAVIQSNLLLEAQLVEVETVSLCDTCDNDTSLCNPDGSPKDECDHWSGEE